jgi:hypothetical protein
VQNLIEMLLSFHQKQLLMSINTKAVEQPANARQEQLQMADALPPNYVELQKNDSFNWKMNRMGDLAAVPCRDVTW